MATSLALKNEQYEKHAENAGNTEDAEHKKVKITKVFDYHMLLRIITPDSLFLELQTKKIDIKGATEGDVTILPLHKPYVSYVKECAIKIVDSNNEEYNCNIGSGFLRVDNYRCVLTVSYANQQAR